MSKPILVSEQKRFFPLQLIAVLILIFTGIWFYQTPRMQKVQDTFASTQKIVKVTMAPSRGPASIEGEIEQSVLSNDQHSAEPIKTLENEFQNKIEIVQQQLSSDTKNWSAKLPQPKTDLQKALWLFVQLARDQDAAITNLLNTSAVQFLSADAATADYFFSMLPVLEEGGDQKVRNFIYQFSRNAFPDVAVGNWLLNDFDKALKHPQKFRLKDQGELQDLIMRSPDIAWERKRAIFNSLPTEAQ